MRLHRHLVEMKFTNVSSMFSISLNSLANLRHARVVVSQYRGQTLQEDPLPFSSMPECVEP